MSNTAEPPSYAAFRQWLSQIGVDLHPSLTFHNDPITGWGLFAQGEEIPANTKVLRMPGALAITPLVARTAILDFFHDAFPYTGHMYPQSEARAAFEKLSQRETLLLYLVLARYALETGTTEQNAKALGALTSHQPYIRILSELEPTVPTSYTDAELDLLAHTSLGSATGIKRQRLQQGAHNVSRFLLELTLLGDSVANTSVRKWFADLAKFALDGSPYNEAHRQGNATAVHPNGNAKPTPKLQAYWDWADYMYSSRAFPATLAYPGTQRAVRVPPWEDEDLEPVLLPGLDCFNHQRAAQVVWHVGRAANPYTATSDQGLFACETYNSHSASEARALASCASAIAFELQYAVAPGEQAWNNYGAKGNEELLNAYGFTIAGGPDDYVRLTLPVEPPLEVNLSQTNVNQVHDAVQPVIDWSGWQGDDAQLKAYDCLTDMLQAKLDAISESLNKARNAQVGHEIRQGNLHNVLEYLSNQHDILVKAIATIKPLGLPEEHNA